VKNTQRPAARLRQAAANTTAIMNKGG
jgi:hypothetical protein